jgi:hypothetical protein
MQAPMPPEPEDAADHRLIVAIAHEHRGAEPLGVQQPAGGGDDADVQRPERPAAVGPRRPRHLDDVERPLAAGLGGLQTPERRSPSTASLTPAAFASLP